jgi:uncharacterized cupin superfamily protein
MLGHRVRETTNTAGTGTIDLGGAVGTGFRTFADEFSSGSKVIYVISNVDTAGDGDYEIGIGTLTHGTPDTLTRDTVLESSNSGNKLNLSGTYSVFNDISALYTPVDRTGENIASAATTNIGAAAGNFVHVTGTTTITSLGTAPVAGRRVTVIFDGALTLTHGASAIVLPGGANITTAAGDIGVFRADTTTKWVCESYTKASGEPVITDGMKITLGTEQASTSGTSIDFTSIPSWVKRITIMFVGVSTNGTDAPLIQIGDSGGIEATGYLGTGSSVSGSVGSTNYTTGFGIRNAAAASVIHGAVTLYLEDAANFTWVASGALGLSDSAVSFVVSGSKSLSAALDRVRITTSGGTNTFDAGAINIMYE